MIGYNSDVSDVLMEASVTVLPSRECGGTPENQTCVLSPSGVCPNVASWLLACKAESGWIPVGLPMYASIGCKGSAPSTMFVHNVSHLGDWIFEEMDQPMGRALPVCIGFMCSLGNCVSNKSLCDGKADCLDGADEMDCRETEVVDSCIESDPACDLSTKCSLLDPHCVCHGGKFR